jgi:hypothetical protein
MSDPSSASVNEMNLDAAKDVVLAAVWEDLGTFTLLRIGQDPSSGRMRELREALRALWRHLKDQDSIPSDIAGAVGFILHMRDEAIQNIKARTDAIRPDLLTKEMPELCMGAFEVLAGWDAQPVPRYDLGDTPADFARKPRG